MSEKIDFLVFDATSECVRLQDNWTTHNLARIDHQLERFPLIKKSQICIDASGLTAFDTSGALILLGLIRKLKKNHKNHKKQKTVSIIHFKEEYQELYDLISKRLENQPARKAPRKISFLENIGQKTWGHFEQAHLLLSFLGELAVYFYASILQPKKFRLKLILGHMEDTGVYAIPIVGLLSFLLGIVIGYQGGSQLKDYGANIFVVELVSLTMLRELAPMMTAVIIAGRTGSAFTAQIGTMKVTEEINAMRTIGMAPMDILVIPRIIALMITLPLLIVFADIMGVFGGMVMAASMLDVSFYSFLHRLPEAVSLTSFFLGVGKAPVFAMIIAVVGCFQGFQVQGSGESVGRQTTISVVQIIFILILADAVFSIVFSMLGI